MLQPGDRGGRSVSLELRARRAAILDLRQRARRRGFGRRAFHDALLGCGSIPQPLGGGGARALAAYSASRGRIGVAVVPALYVTFRFPFCTEMVFAMICPPVMVAGLPFKLIAPFGR